LKIAYFEIDNKPIDMVIFKSHGHGQAGTAPWMVFLRPVDLLYPQETMEKNAHRDI